MKSNEPIPLTLTVKSFTKRSDLSVNTAYRLMNRGDLRSTKVGKRRLIFWQSYLDYLDRIGAAPFPGRRVSDKGAA